MSAQRQELTAPAKPFNFMATTLKEAQEYATIFANSGLCPENYKGRPNDILIIWQLGKELGLDKMQSLRTLGCVNGMPFAYGDGQLALIKRHPDYEAMKEWFEGDMDKGTLKAICMMKRRNEEPVVREFSMKDAILAGLWDKKGVWKTYPKRMLQHRARGFCAKDTYPDALYGLMSEHEVNDITESKNTPTVTVASNSKGVNGLKETLGIKKEPDIIDAEIIVETDKTDETVVAVEDTATAVTTEADDDIQANVKPLTKYHQLTELIRRNQIHGTKIKTYLKRCNAKRIKDLTDEQMDKWINHLTKKESKDAI